MAETTVTIVDCPYRVDISGVYVNGRKRTESKQALIRIKEMVADMKGNTKWLDMLVYDLEVNGIKSDWLKKSREELLNTVYLMPELEVVATDNEMEKMRKLILSAELIELIGA